MYFNPSFAKRGSRGIPVAGKLLIHIAGTFGFTWLIFEMVIIRDRFLRVLFGMKPRQDTADPS